MASWLGEKLVRGKISKQAEKHLEIPNPYYYYEENELPNGQIQKKKIKRQMPAGISKNDEKILKSIRRTAWYMDLFFGACGIRAGWAAIIGWVPYIGLAINVWIGYQLVNKANKIDGGLPTWTRSKMMANITVDAALQFVPFVGDIAAAFYKSNARNCAIFEKYLIAKGSKLTGGSSHPTEDEYELAPHPTHKSTRYANGGFEMSGSSTARPLAQAL